MTGPELLWIADGRTYGYVGGSWLILEWSEDIGAWNEPTKQEPNDRKDWSPQLVHPSTG
jgi:hypothetical protein